MMNRQSRHSPKPKTEMIPKKHNSKDEEQSQMTPLAIEMYQPQTKLEKGRLEAL
jgi:hypothetical protein